MFRNIVNPNSQLHQSRNQFFSYSASQTLSSIKLTITSASYIIDKEQNNCIFCSQSNINNDLNVTNNDNVQSCETPKKVKASQTIQLQNIMRNVLVPCQCVPLIYTPLQNYLQWVNKMCVFILVVDLPRLPSVLNQG